MIDPTWIATIAADPTFFLSSEPNWLDYAAPAIAGVSAIVIGFQAWYTRQSVVESKRAVGAAEDAVDVAQRALTQSQLARLEGSVPRIWVSSEGSFGYEAKKLIGHSMMEVEANEIFRMPSDSALILRTMVPIRIHNDGPGSAQLHSSRALIREDGHNVGRDVLIRPGESFTGHFSVVKMVSQWVALSEQTDERLALAIQITYRGPKDADVDEVHELCVYNSLLGEDKTKVGDWSVASFYGERMTARVSPATRTYWQSRRNNEEFDLF